MEYISESTLAQSTQESLDKLLDGLFTQVQEKVGIASQWPALCRHGPVITRRQGNFFQRESKHSDVSYDAIRQLLYTNHTLNETKYIESLIEAHAQFKIPTPTEGEAGVYWLWFKAGLANSREFIELVATREQVKDGRRSFMVVSKPVRCDTPVPVRFVRGAYEAWELVRELPEGGVEWICIQRSQPGGWIPQRLANWVIGREFHKDVDAALHYIKHASPTL